MLIVSNKIELEWITCVSEFYRQMHFVTCYKWLFRIRVLF